MDDTHKSPSRISDNFFKIITKDSEYKYDLASIADELNISQKHLTKSVKQVTGYPPSYFIKRKTVFEAKVLLKETYMTLQEIADKLGFVDVAYFSKFFKVTPLEFRRGMVK